MTEMPDLRSPAEKAMAAGELSRWDYGGPGHTDSEGSMASWDAAREAWRDILRTHARVVIPPDAEIGQRIVLAFRAEDDPTRIVGIGSAEESPPGYPGFTPFEVAIWDMAGLLADHEGPPETPHQEEAA